MRWTAWLAASMSVVACFSCAQGEDSRDFIGETGGTGGAGGSSAAGGTGASAGQAGTGASAGEAGTGGGETGGTGGSTGGTGGSTGGTGGSTGGTGGGTCVPPVVGECTIYPHTGCLTLEGCYVTDPATGETECAYSAGYGAGELCEFLNDCEPGTACVGGACKPYCSQPSNCAVAGADCFQVEYGSGSSVPCMKVCTDQCDPANPSVVCGLGASCDVFSDQGVTPGTSLCYDSGSSNTGACSSTSSACAPGWVCLTDDLCHRWCRVGSSDCGASSCQAAGYYVGSQQYGFCP